MAKPTKSDEHIWKRGDSLTKLAVQHKFANWRRIWDYSENAELKAKRKTPDKLKRGDKLKIPVIVKGKDAGNTEMEHKFERLGAPPAMVCFIDDNGQPRDRYSKRIDNLQVSYWVTTNQLPRKWWQASKDRRNFKIEVVDAGAVKKGLKTIEVELEALKPKLDPKGIPVRVDDDGKPVSAADAAKGKGHIEYESFKKPRKLKVQLKRMRKWLRKTLLYRSQYIRLVTDNEDNKVRPTRTLLADHDPDDLRVEILDQIVQVNYKTTPTKAQPEGEPLSAVATIGKAQKRYRMTVQILRLKRGGATSGGLKRADVYRHVRSWVRRTYAQVNMSPMLVDFCPLPTGTPATGVSAKDESLIGVREIDPPGNMVSIFNYWSKKASGKAVLSFRLRCKAGGKNVEKHYTLDGTQGDRVKAGETPEETCKKFAKLLLKDGFLTRVHKNPRHDKNGRSADLIIWHSSGDPVTVDKGRMLHPTTGKYQWDRQVIRTTRVRPKKFTETYTTAYHPDGEDRWGNVGTRDMRSLCHNYRSYRDGKDEGVLDAFVAHRFRGGNWGLAVGYDWVSKAAKRGTYPLRASVYVQSRTVDRKDRYVHTLDHECGHVLADMYHIDGWTTQMMTDAGANTKNSYFDQKRISDGKFRVTWPAGTYVNVAKDTRKREAALLMKDWEDYPEYPKKPPP